MHLVRDGDQIIVPTGVGEPPTLLTALSECRRDFRDVKVSQILAVRKYGYVDPETSGTCATWRCSTAAPRGRAGSRAGSTSSPTTSPKSRR